MALRDLIADLAGVVDAGTVLGMAEADLADLVLLAEVEKVLKEDRGQGAQDG